MFSELSKLCFLNWKLLEKGNQEDIDNQRFVVCVCKGAGSTGQYAKSHRVYHLQPEGPGQMLLIRFQAKELGEPIVFILPLGRPSNQ